MRKLLVVAVLVAISQSLPQIASAQNTSQSQPSTSVQARVKSNLEQAGFKNVQIMPSSFLVRATDTDGNPVMMVINPDSVTAVTDLSVGRQGSAGSNDQLNLTSTQRAEIWQNLSNQAKETPPAGFTPKVGEAVPSSIRVQPLPGSVSSQVPAVKSYDFAMLQNEVLIVDPTSKKIVDVISR